MISLSGSLGNNLVLGHVYHSIHFHQLGTIAEIRTAVLDGDSWYYVRLDGADTFYAMAASKDRNVVILNVGDAVSIQISPEDSGNAIVNALSISTGNAAPDPVKEEPDNATDAGGTEPTTPTEE